MLSGDNSILSRATQARTKTGNAQDEETISLAYLAAITGNYTNGDDISTTLRSELEKTYGTGNVTVTKSGDIYKVKIKEKGTYKIDKNGNVEKAIIADRTGIKIGDYVTYTSPTASVTFNAVETGYASYETPETLNRKTLFRVLDIDDEGNLELMGAMNSSDKTICFSGAQGYNNVVYVLNKKCSDLYKNEAKEITARSIKEEDITKRFNAAGKKKMTDYLDERVGNVETPTSKTLKTGTYITNVDPENKTVTYVNSKAYYPNIFQYEVGGKIGDIATNGIVARSDSYNGYGEDGILTNSDTEGDPVTAIPQFLQSSTTLTIPYTYSYSTHDENDFTDSTNKTAYNRMFFGTGTDYWLASRCIGCGTNKALFETRTISSTALKCSDRYSVFFGWYSK